MEAEHTQQIRACAELSVGDEIEAWHNGRLFHRGLVTQTVPTMDLFWIIDERTGARRLLDVDALEILRIRAARAAAAGPQGLGREPGRGLPSAGHHRVLFQAPT
jgi:hypothetical protein